MADETLKKSEVVNMLNKAIADEREKLQRHYCPTILGCHKGKEIDSYIHGPLASKLSDLRFHVDAVEKDFPEIKNEVKEMKTSIGHVSDELIENRKSTKAFIYTIISGLVIGFLTNLFVIKTNIEAKNADVTTQQYNQERMEKKLAELLEALEMQVKAKKKMNAVH